MSIPFDKTIFKHLKDCLQKISEETDDKHKPEEVARLIYGELRGFLDGQQQTVDWSVPLATIQDLHKIENLGGFFRAHVTVKQMTKPRPFTVESGDEMVDTLITEAVLVDETGTSIATIPVTQRQIVNELARFSCNGRVFEVLGMLTDFSEPSKQREFRFLLLDLRPIEGALARIKATPQEIEDVAHLVEHLASLDKDALFDYIRDQVKDALGIIDLENDKAFQMLIDKAIITALSCGWNQSTPGALHHLIIGASGIGKKLVAKVLKVLSPKYRELGVSKISAAGLVGTAKQSGGSWKNTPGLIPQAHEGALIVEDLHEVKGKEHKVLTGMLLKVMEDGEIMDSTSGSAKYDSHVSVHVDQNMKGDVYGGEEEIHYTLQNIGLPKHFLSRVDFISVVPRDPERQRQLARRIAGTTTPRRKSSEKAKRELQVIIAHLRDSYAEPDLSQVEDLMAEAMEEICDLNIAQPFKHFEDFLLRMAVSLQKTVKAVCRSRALGVAGESEVSEAKRLLRSKIDFLSRLENRPINTASWGSKRARQETFANEFRGQETTVKNVASWYEEQGVDVDERTIRRDLKDVGAEQTSKGVWLLPSSTLQ